MASEARRLVGKRRYSLWFPFYGRSVVQHRDCRSVDVSMVVKCRPSGVGSRRGDNPSEAMREQTDASILNSQPRAVAVWICPVRQVRSLPAPAQGIGKRDESRLVGDDRGELAAARPQTVRSMMHDPVVMDVVRSAARRYWKNRTAGLFRLCLPGSMMPITELPGQPSVAGDRDAERGAVVGDLPYRPRSLEQKAVGVMSECGDAGAEWSASTVQQRGCRHR